VRAIVERVLCRRTIAFMSGIDILRDLAVEMLRLEALSAPANGRA
jgi:hypothetical protein